MISVFQRAGIRGYVDGVMLEHRERDDLERSFVRRRQDDRRAGPIRVSAQPFGSGDAPSVTGSETREAVLRHRGRQVVADTALMIQELGGDDGAHGVATEIVGIRVARSISEPAGHRIDAAGLQLAAEDVSLHTPIIAARRRDPEYDPQIRSCNERTSFDILLITA